MFGYKNKTYQNRFGFTLIELLVVLSIISLLASIGLIAFQQARIKSRNVRRLADMTQMDTALEMFFANNRGYPSGTNGIPSNIVPTYTSAMAVAPVPEDDACASVVHSASCVAADPACNNVPANTYYYVALGTPYPGGSGITVYPSYTYYFCLGDKTGDFSAGERMLTPTGVK